MFATKASSAPTSGHSLLDLIFAIGLLAILTTPMIAGRILGDLQFYNAHRQLAIDCNALALDVMLSEQSATLELNADYYSLFSNGKEIAKRKLPNGVQVSLPHVLPTTVTFYPTTATTPLTIELQSDQKICRVIISLRGRVRTECI